MLGYQFTKLWRMLILQLWRDGLAQLHAEQLGSGTYGCVCLDKELSRLNEACSW